MRSDVMTEKSIPEVPMPAGLDEMVKQNGRNMEAISKSSGIYFEGMTRMSEEIFQFGFHRLREDIGLMSKLAGCGTPQQIAEAQMDFVAKMVTDYNEETRKLMELAGKITEKSCAAAQPETPKTRKRAG